MSAKNMDQFSQKFANLSAYLIEQKIAALYLSGSDSYLSEYSAKEESLRNYLIPFTGSTAETVILSGKKVLLFVDGRYHLQADMECKDCQYVEVIKVNSQVSLMQEVVNYLKQEELIAIACLSDRTPLNIADRFSSIGLEVVSLSTTSIADLIGYKSLVLTAPVEMVAKNILASHMEQKFERLNLPIKQGIYLSSCDDVAWLSHCRSYQIPCNSYFLCKALVTSDHLFVFLPKGVKVSNEAQQISEITFLHADLDDLLVLLQKSIDESGITQIIYDPTTVTIQDYQMLLEMVEEENLIKRNHPVAQLKAHKTPAEIKEFERSYLLSSQAIAETIRYAKKQVQEGASLSEADLANTIWQNYAKRGAKALSFNTISGFGKNSAIIHYGGASADCLATQGEIILLDSGAYYESGFATDCTRTFVVGIQKADQAKLKQWKKMYTLVLRAQIQAEMSHFKPATLGNAIDQVARGVLLSQGFDFQHGLGHGVGIRVHEPAAGRLSAFSREELHPGVVCSIEPGYYVDGEYGIRLENVEYVTTHASYPNHLRFKPLIYVGWEEELIDWPTLSQDETAYLKAYQAKCMELGTHTHI